MTETPGSYAGEIIPQPSHCLTRAEQMALLLWHPFFTGQCPQCGQALVHVQPACQWQCGCGWKEDSKHT